MFLPRFPRVSQELNLRVSTGFGQGFTRCYSWNFQRVYPGCPRLTGCLSRRYDFQGVYDFPSVVVYDFQGSDKGFPRYGFPEGLIMDY